MAVKIMHIGGTTFIGDLVNLGRVLKNPRVIRVDSIPSKLAGAPEQKVVSFNTLFDHPASMEVGSFNYAYPASAQVAQMYNQTLVQRAPAPFEGKTVPPEVDPVTVQ